MSKFLKKYLYVYPLYILGVEIFHNFVFNLIQGLLAISGGEKIRNFCVL
jgi:hypothetical protein